MPSPIFMLGIQRSGTTGLANQIVQHPQISAVMNKWHGTHESVYFSHLYNRYGDLSDESNYIEFVSVMAENDYFILAGMNKEALYQLWPSTYETVFRQMMDAYAEQQQTAFWLARDPHHTPLVELISQFYPDARFIYIERDIQDIIRSHIKMSRRTLGKQFATNRLKRAYFSFRTTYRWMFYKTMIQRFQKKAGHRICYIHFDAYVSSPGDVLQKVCAFLAIDFDPAMLEMPAGAGRNTSFKANEQERATIIDTVDVLFIRCLIWLFRLVVPVTSRLLPPKLGYASSGSLPYWFFKMFDRLPREDG